MTPAELLDKLGDAPEIEELRAHLAACDTCEIGAGGLSYCKDAARLVLVGVVPGVLGRLVGTVTAATPPACEHKVRDGARCSDCGVVLNPWAS